MIAPLSRILKVIPALKSVCLLNERYHFGWVHRNTILIFASTIKSKYHQQPSHLCLCAGFTLGLRWVCAGFALGLRWVCPVFALCLRCVCAVFALGLRWVCAGFALGLRWVCAGFALGS